MLRLHFSSAVFLGLCALLPATADAEPPCVESSRLRIVFREDLNGLKSILDLKTGRDYAQESAEPIGLYALRLGKWFNNAIRLNSIQASKRRWRTEGDALILEFEHEAELPLQVRCRVWARKGDAFIRWRIEVINRSDRPVIGVGFPLAQLKVQLGESADDDRIVYPLHEGVLLCKPAKLLGKRASVSHSYPGALSAQFYYFYDRESGFYMAAEDGGGHTKSSVVSRRDGSLILSFMHTFPSEVHERTALGYDVVWTCGDGSWYAGANIYKRWAERQPWCKKRLTERDVPQWLKEGNVFLNYGARVQNVFFPASVALKTFNKYRDFLGVPLVCVPFGWEKHGAWIGPEYFPPYGGEENYIRLARGLAERGDHLHLYLSGFRWGARKPISGRKEKPRRYTDYDGTAEFMKKGKPAAVVKADGSLDLQKQPWADNYTLCVGSEIARGILADCYRRVFDWGVAGVDIDQNVGGAASACFNTEHGHPVGVGRWISQAMLDFLQGVRVEAKSKHPDCFMGIEEPCEFFIPCLDIYHGRAFTDTRWPANAPGGVSIPLFIYLYHEYILGYAGWCDGGFSPMGDVRMGLARSFIFGMQPGVRISRGEFVFKDDKPTEQLEMLRDIGKLMRKAAGYLLLGRMLPEPAVSDSPFIEQRALKGWLKRPPLPIRWKAVQATAWMSPEGNVCYAVANLSADSVSPQIEISPNGMKAEWFTLRLLKPDSEEILLDSVELPRKIRLQLKPWEVLCIEQLPAKGR